MHVVIDWLITKGMQGCFTKVACLANAYNILVPTSRQATQFQSNSCNLKFQVVRVVRLNAPMSPIKASVYDVHTTLKCVEAQL